MGTYNWQDMAALAPAIILVAGGCVLLLSEVALKSASRGYQAGLSVFFATFAGLAAWSQLSGAGRDLFGGFARLDAFGSAVAIIICFALALTSLVSQSFLREHASERGEFHALAHFAAAGMIILADATDLITLFIALEVMSLAIYALTAYLRSSARPAEAALKYFVLGSFSSAVLLYGASLAYGAAGSTRLTDIAAAVQGGAHLPLIYAALALVGAGFLFKVAAVPFHMWAPDVYEGAPTPVTGFMAAGVKTAAFAAIVRTLYVAFGAKTFALGAPGGKGWYGAVATLAVLTMVGGNLLALAQRSVKRMLAYSSISHAGYLLVGVAAGAFGGATRAAASQATLYYLLAYTATAIGAFTVVAALEKRGGPEVDDDARYDGLSQRDPVLAFVMAIFMVSLAGIPPTAGFTAKLFIFRSALDVGAVGLAVVGLLSSVAGLYYYLRVVVVMYMKPAPANAPAAPTRLTSMNFGLAIAATVTLVVGIAPHLVRQVAHAVALLSP